MRWDEYICLVYIRYGIRNMKPSAVRILNIIYVTYPQSEIKTEAKTQVNGADT